MWGFFSYTYDVVSLTRTSKMHWHDNLLIRYFCLLHKYKNITCIVFCAALIHVCARVLACRLIPANSRMNDYLIKYVVNVIFIKWISNNKTKVKKFPGLWSLLVGDQNSIESHLCFREYENVTNYFYLSWYVHAFIYILGI